MLKENDYTQEKSESSEQIILKEIYYNCPECSSSIEILSINEKESSIEFRCINNNHQRKMLIKEYLDKIKDYTDKRINNDICQIHNNKYECYCLDCNIHLCKECLKLRRHINHTKNNIIEIQPNDKELDTIKNIIKYYDNKIENLEKEKLNKTKDLNNKLKLNKNKLKERKELKIKENINNMNDELKSNNDNYILDIENIRKEYENKIKLRKYKYKKDVIEINKKYKLISEKINILYNNKIEELDMKYIKIIQKYEFNKNIEDMKNINRLNEIIYNTYNIYNNNYYNSININNIIIYNNKINLNNNLNNEYINISKVKDENQIKNNIINEYEEKLKYLKLNYENKIIEILKEYNIIKNKYENEINYLFIYF